jgi:hypothetical protein
MEPGQAMHSAEGRVMGAPEYLLIAWCLIFALGNAMLAANPQWEKPMTPTVRAIRVFAVPAIVLGLAYWGGMFA